MKTIEANLTALKLVTLPLRYYLLPSDTKLKESPTTLPAVVEIDVFAAPVARLAVELDTANPRAPLIQADGAVRVCGPVLVTIN